MPSWTLIGSYVTRGEVFALTRPSTPSDAATEGLGHSGRSSAGIFSVAQSAAWAVRPYRYALPMLDSSNP